MPYMKGIIMLEEAIANTIAIILDGRWVKRASKKSEVPSKVCLSAQLLSDMFILLQIACSTEADSGRRRRPEVKSK